jgi:nucleoside diphosphate kinase
MYAVRTALNDKRVVDPSRVVMSDVTNLNRNVIRLKPEAYGTDPRLAVHQLQTRDPTQNHLGSMQYVEQMIQRASGVVDNLMGLINQGGRKTATEVRNATGMATNRLKTLAEYNSALGWAPLIQFMVQTTQQLYDEELQLRTAGNTLKGGEPVLVTPESIAGFYDFVPVDGTMPIDRLAQANFWKELLSVIASSPEMAMSWDLGSMIAHVMMLQGERNVERFRLQAGSPQMLQQQAAAGNIVPIGGRSGSQRGLPAPTGSTGGTL